jgi:hypothetical protein
MTEEDLDKANSEDPHRNTKSVLGSGFCTLAAKRRPNYQIGVIISHCSGHG